MTRRNNANGRSTGESRLVRLYHWVIMSASSQSLGFGNLAPQPQHIARLRTAFPNIPIYAALGNNDTACGDYQLDARSPFLTTVGAKTGARQAMDYCRIRIWTKRPDPILLS